MHEDHLTITIFISICYVTVLQTVERMLQGVVSVNDIRQRAQINMHKGETSMPNVRFKNT